VSRLVGSEMCIRDRAVAADDLLAIAKVAIGDRLVQEGAEDIRLIGALHHKTSIDEEAGGAVVLFVIHEGESLPQSGSQPHPRRPPYH
jgi:hypothetical protein